MPQRRLAALLLVLLWSTVHARFLPDHMQNKVDLEMALVDKDKAAQSAAQWKALLQEHNYEEVTCDNLNGTIMNGTYSCHNINLVGFLSATDELGSNSDTIFVNDLWGWIDEYSVETILGATTTTTEYSFVGLYDGVSIVDLSQSPPGAIAFVNATDNFVDNGGRWKDIKVINDVAYIGSEISSHGIQVLDLKRLRTLDRGRQGNNNDITTARSIPRIEPDYVAREVGSTHNLVAAAAAGKLLAVGMSAHGVKDDDNTTTVLCAAGSVAVFDVAGPNALAPVFERCYLDESLGYANSAGYVHDAQCIRYHGPDERYQGHNVCALFAERIVSLLNLDTWETISEITYPAASYIHQGWFTEDHSMIFVDDELDELLHRNFGKLEDAEKLTKFEESLGYKGLNAAGIKNSGMDFYSKTYIIDASNLTSLSLMSPFQSRVQSIDHNLYVKEDKIYHANYASGARVRQIMPPNSNDTDTATLEEVGFFDFENDCDNDSDPTVCDPFSGAWTHYPYYDSGITTASSIFEGLFILRPTV